MRIGGSEGGVWSLTDCAEERRWPMDRRNEAALPRDWLTVADRRDPQKYSVLADLPVVGASGCGLSRAKRAVLAASDLSLVGKPAVSGLNDSRRPARSRLARQPRRSRAQLAAESVPPQTGGEYQTRTKLRHADHVTRIILAGLSRFLACRQLLVMVKARRG